MSEAGRFGRFAKAARVRFAPPVVFALVLTAGLSLWPALAASAGPLDDLAEPVTGIVGALDALTETAPAPDPSTSDAPVPDPTDLDAPDLILPSLDPLPAPIDTDVVGLLPLTPPGEEDGGGDDGDGNGNGGGEPNADTSEGRGKAGSKGSSSGAEGPAGRPAGDGARGAGAPEHSYVMATGKSLAVYGKRAGELAGSFAAPLILAVACLLLVTMSARGGGTLVKLDESERVYRL